ncbi:hypothetical protein HMPREF3137_27335 [Achromobacter xylosoxidans]|nr:hypothetical protein HMPREF3137_27335 [Achromobacter xylosoxidans]
MWPFARHQLAKALGPEISYALRLILRPQKEGTDLRHIKLSLATVLSNEEVLIRLYPMRSCPALRRSHDDHEAACHSDCLHLKTRHPGLNPVKQYVLESSGLFVRISKLRNNSISSTLTVLVNAVN